MTRYWSVEIDGLDEASANSLVKFLMQHGHRAEAVDPRWWLTRHLDRESVMTIAETVRVRLAQGADLDEVEEAGLLSLLEDFDEWLADARTAP